VITKRAVIDSVTVEYDVYREDDEHPHYCPDTHEYLGKGYFAEEFLRELWIADAKDPADFEFTSLARTSICRFYLEKNKSAHPN